MEIWELLIAAREAAGMTQAQVAAARQVSRSAHSHLERVGARPTWDTIDSFAKAIDASVTVRFDLANGQMVSGRCAGIHRPTLADDLFSEADRARTEALEAGWIVGRDRRVAAAMRGHGEFATVQRLAAIIEPKNWTLQTTLTVLMSMAAAHDLLTASSEFGSLFDGLRFNEPDEDMSAHSVGTAEMPSYGVAEESRMALNALLMATHHAAVDAREGAEYTTERARRLPVRGLMSYLATGAPGAEDVASLVARTGADSDWCDRILQRAGYLYSGHADGTKGPRFVFTMES